MTAPRRQKGFSLVELMVALVLGLMVGGAVLQSFIYNNRSIVMQREAVALQEQGRAAMEFITRFARMAGFQEHDFRRGALSLGVSGSSDSISIEFQAGGSDASISLRNCLGQAVSSQGWVSVNRFHVNGSNQLVCDAKFRESVDGTLKEPSSSTYQADGVLIENVTDMQVLYGVDTDNDQAANQYVQTPSGSDWEDVVALKLCIVLASSKDILSSDTVFKDCDQTDMTATRKLTRQVRATVALRNRAGG
ncbi:PilW family protein [Motiliproteus sp. SC1-56]|uniref:PilW family protein n=1 Tax=Motiliproteus sp. SC1-56 TaxID=2799565 RepID=UPI001A90C2D6|nr:PilW family protein [Motiliproteus sp. SC1-56]